jgi:hypothetical protein
MFRHTPNIENDRALYFMTRPDEELGFLYYKWATYLHNNMGATATSLYKLSLCNYQASRQYYEVHTYYKILIGHMPGRLARQTCPADFL